MKWDGGPCGAGAALWLVVMAVLQPGRAGGKGLLSPPATSFCLPLGIDSLLAFPSWISQHSGILETLLRLGTNLLSAGWPCTSCVSRTGNNSDLPVSRSQHRPGSPAQEWFWKSYLTYGECPLDLLGQLFFFPVCHQNCPVDMRLEINCCVIQQQQFGVRLKQEAFLLSSLHEVMKLFWQGNSFGGNKAVKGDNLRICAEVKLFQSPWLLASKPETGRECIIYILKLVCLIETILCSELDSLQ